MVTAVAEAAQSRWIETLGEWDAREFTTDADAAAAWCDLTVDSAIVAHPEIRLVSGYTVQDGSAGGSHFRNWLDAIKASGCRLPDAIALDKYGGDQFTPANNVSAIMQRVNNYLQTFVGYEIWIPEMGVLGGDSGTGVTMSGNPQVTFTDNGASGDTIVRATGSFIADGFANGNTIAVDNATKSGNNFTSGTITALTATTITFGATPALTNEGPRPDIWIAKVPGPPSPKVVRDTMLSLTQTLDVLPRVTRYAWWYQGPASCCGASAGVPGGYQTSNEFLYRDDATITLIGETWKTLGRNLPYYQKPARPTNAKIVALGDSITRGFDCSGASNATTYNGFRSGLDTAAVADGYSLQWIGSQNNSTASYVATRLHEGVNGDSCADKLPTAGATNAAGSTTSKVSDVFGQGRTLHGADVIIVFLCTNGENPALGGTFAANYKQLIETIHYLEPQADFVGVEGYHANCTAQTANLRADWDALNAEGIHIARTGASTLTGGDLCDGIHPTASGYTKMAGDIYPALKRALQGRL